MATIRPNLPAALAEVTEELRSGDELLTTDELRALSIFEEVKKAPPFERFPGTTVLRRCTPGRVMCSQGNAGATAYYILTTEDVLELRERQLELTRAMITAKMDGAEHEVHHQYLRLLDQAELRKLENTLYIEINKLRTRVQQLDESDDETERSIRAVASANLLVDLSERRSKKGLLHRLRRWFARGTGSKVSRPQYIPNDGPADIDVKTLKAPLHEAEIFGEMSCMNRAPRSATVIAEQECYMLEMLRNVLNNLHRDPAFKKKMDDVYRSRVLETQIRRLSVFQELTDEEFALLRDRVELIDFDSGAVIFEEFDPSDCFYVIRSGLVKVVQNVGCTIRDQEFAAGQWKQLCLELNDSAGDKTGACQQVCKSLPDGLLTRVADSGDASSPEDKTALVQALNDFVRNAALHSKLGKTKQQLVEVVDSTEMRAAVVDFPNDPENWSEIERRTFHRLLLETACPEGMPHRAASVGPRRNLAYLGRGEFIGEMGLFLDQPRSASCIAYDHPESGYSQRIPDSRTGAVPSRVELVRIGKQEFAELLEMSPGLRDRIEQTIGQRQQRSLLHRERTMPETAYSPTQAPDFEQLGLIQGQELMLIDLDRCTRCGACVDACVNAHDDGHTRLYLDGPRFNKYLVPLTCRKCLDPVCMIGCPVGSILRGDNGEIQIRDWCIGCTLCADQCPYGSIQMNQLDDPVELTESEKLLLEPGAEIKSVIEQAVVCDLCSSLPSRDPACVYACPHDAALRVNANEFFQGPALAAADAAILTESDSS